MGIQAHWTIETVEGVVKALVVVLVTRVKLGLLAVS